jgi:hypothetical protein
VRRDCARDGGDQVLAGNLLPVYSERSSRSAVYSWTGITPICENEGDGAL